MPPTTPHSLTRRDVLKVAGATLLPVGLGARATKKVIVAGGGIAGLCCGYELMRRWHDVTLLEASDRTGGHVYTITEGLDDGLYGDGGASRSSITRVASTSCTASKERCIRTRCWPIRPCSRASA